MPRKKVSYMKFLDSSWVDQIQAFNQYIDEANEAISKAKDYEEANDIIDLLINGTIDYLEADAEDTGRIDRRHQSFVKQLVDLHLVKDYILSLQEKRIESFQSIILSFGALKEQNLFDLVPLFSQEIIKNLDSVDPKDQTESVSYLFLINKFGLYCLEFQFNKEAEYFFDLALDFLDKNRLPFSKNFFLCYIGKALICEGNQKFDAALEVYIKFLDHVLETVPDLTEWWKDETSEKLMLLKEAFFYSFIYAFYLSDEKTMAKAYTNFPMLKDRTLTSRLIHVIMTASEARLRLQDMLIEAENFEEIYMVFNEVYQYSNLRGWKDRRVELKHPEAKIYLPRILNTIMESKPKYGILLVESSTRIRPDQEINFYLGDTLLREIPVHTGEKHKYVELGDITFIVEADTVQVFASMLEAKKTSELVLKHKYWPEYKVKLSLAESGLLKFKQEELVRELKLKDGGVEYMGRMWARTETLTDMVRAIGDLPTETFNFKYEDSFRKFCKEFSGVLKKIGRKEEAKALAEMGKQEFITGESVRLVIIQRLSELGIKKGVSAEELETITRDIILKKVDQ